MAFLSHRNMTIGTANRKSPVFTLGKDSECGTEEMAAQEPNRASLFWKSVPRGLVAEVSAFALNDK